MLSFINGFTFALLIITGAYSFETSSNDNIWYKNVNPKGNFDERASILRRQNVEDKSLDKNEHLKERIIDMIDDKHYNYRRKIDTLVNNDKVLNLHDELRCDKKFQKSDKEFILGENMDNLFDTLKKNNDFDNFYNSCESVNEDASHSLRGLENDIHFEDSSDNLKHNNCLEDKYKLIRQKRCLHKFRNQANIGKINDPHIVKFFKKMDSKLESEILNLLENYNRYYVDEYKPRNISSTLKRNRMYLPFILNVFIIIMFALSGSLLGICTFQILGILMAIYYKYKTHKCQKLMDRIKNTSRVPLKAMK
ncbi:Plasmodium exported protein, unknown function [Plasmodium gonderi]|uniref:Pv-fam-d protein n=1 Tax=Plasmodium gonderi TaxID=77519 RepID=A0A1Y1JSX9_PLAGO|nr:Plasmodium exported protein, unknown function [Plasmodium gonderi]GAW83892.1 Plasmodium exported protein, unknown function [Plasmodium gonderi]